MANRFSLIVAAALAVGCAEAEPAAMEGPAPCEGSIDPGPYWAEAEAAAERLYDATGCALAVESDGTPVRAGEAKGQDGHATCGATAITYLGESMLIVSRDRIDLDDGTRGLSCSDTESAILHESIHLLMEHPGYRMPENAGEHAADGAFQPKANKRRNLNLTESTLEVLCAAVSCHWFSAEPALYTGAVPKG